MTALFYGVAKGHKGSENISPARQFVSDDVCLKARSNDEDTFVIRSFQVVKPFPELLDVTLVSVDDGEHVVVVSADFGSMAFQPKFPNGVEVPLHNPRKRYIMSRHLFREREDCCSAEGRERTVIICLTFPALFVHSVCNNHYV